MKVRVSSICISSEQRRFFSLNPSEEPIAGFQLFKQQIMGDNIVRGFGRRGVALGGRALNGQPIGVGNPPRDPDVIRRRLNTSTDSLMAVESRVFPRKKKTMRKLTANLRVLMTQCIRMFTNFAGDYNVDSSAAVQAEDFVELLGVAMLSKGKKEHRPAKLYEKLARITAVYLRELQALHTTVVEEVRAAAIAEQIRNRRLNLQ